MPPRPPQTPPPPTYKTNTECTPPGRVKGGHNSLLLLVAPHREFVWRLTQENITGEKLSPGGFMAECGDLVHVWRFTFLTHVSTNSPKNHSSWKQGKGEIQRKTGKMKRAKKIRERREAKTAQVKRNSENE